MKRTLLTILVMGASFCTAFSQNTKTETTAEAPVKETTQKTATVKQTQDWQNTLVTELKLSDEQVKKIADLNKAFGEREKAIENNANLSDEAKQERKTALKKAQEAQFVKLLTEEQQAKYKELLESKARKD
jgi:hypothetical protein